MPTEIEIQQALHTESTIKPGTDKYELYMEMMGNKKMVDRHTEEDLRNGCMLVNNIWRICVP
jgi:hypothetical protein